MKVVGVAVFVWVVSVSALASAMSPLEITQPVDGSALTFMPVSIAVDFDAAADPQTLQVLLNGNDVTGLLIVDPPSEGWKDHVHSGNDDAVLTDLGLLADDMEDIRTELDERMKDASQVLA